MSEKVANPKHPVNTVALLGNERGYGNPGNTTSKYQESFVETARTAAKAGYTLHELARLLGVSVEAIRIWREEYPEFKEAFAGQAEAWDDRVEESLAHRAMGYKHDAAQIFMNKDGQLVYADYEKVYPPDPTAMKFWLMNRRKDKWRDRQEVENTGKIEIKIGKEFDNL
jgi:hypothetical protein